MDTAASAEVQRQLDRLAAAKLTASRPDAPRHDSSTLPEQPTTMATSITRPAAAQPLAVGDVVHVFASVTSGPFLPELIQSGDKWLSPIMDIAKATAHDRGFVASGVLLDAERLARNIKAKQVKLKGVLFNVSLISDALASQYHGLDEETIPADEVLMDFSDSEFATTSSGSDTDTAAPEHRRKKPRTPAAKTSRRAYKKRREARKRALSNSGSDSEPAAIDPSPAKVLAILATPSTDLRVTNPDLPENPGPSPTPNADRTVNSCTVPPPPPPDAPEQPTAITLPSLPAAKKKKKLFSALDLSKVDVPVDLDPRETILFRPVDPGNSLHRTNPIHLMKALAAFGSTTGRRHIRAGGIAVDYDPATFNETAALATTVLMEIKITVTRPMTQNIQPAGVISGVFPDLTEADICEYLAHRHPGTTVKRLAKPGTQSWIIKVTFATGPVPEKVDLFGRLHRVKPYLDRPLICGNCSRYGHPTRLCRSKARCRSCGLDHVTSTCPTPDAAKCCNCGGEHVAGSQSCPNNAFQAKVLSVRREHNLTFREARTAVTRATRSYAAAVKQPANLPAPATPGAPRQTQTPAPRPETAQAATIQALTELFKAVITIIAEATEAQDYSGLTTKVTTAFALFLTPAEN